MKRLIALLFVLLLVVPALAEDFNPYDYKRGYSGSNYLYYGFPDIYLYMPVEWDGRITAVQSENGVHFYQKASYEKYQEEGLDGGGILFTFCASEDEDFRDLPAYEYLGYSENADLYFYLMLPSDYPAYVGDEAVRAEYDEMSSHIDEIVQLAKIEKNYSFYPMGPEWDSTWPDIA